MHAVVARSTFGSQNVKQHKGFGPLLEVQMSEKVHAVVARSTFPSQNAQSTPLSDHFGGSDVVSRGKRKGLCTLSKVSKT